MNLIKSLQNYVAELEPDLVSTREEGEFLLLILKDKSIADMEHFLSLRKKCGELAPFFSTHIKTIPVVNSPYPRCVEAGFKVNLAELYAEQLRSFFHVGIDEAQIDKCVEFLGKHGWDAARFQNELGISKSSAWRLKGKVSGFLKGAGQSPTVASATQA
jgi:hypothetical protein